MDPTPSTRIVAIGWLRGLPETWPAAALTVAVLYPICIGYRSLRKRSPRSVLRIF